MNVSDSFVGSRSPKTVEFFHQARLVRITGWTFTIWLDPFGMLNPQIVVHLFAQVCVRMELVKHNH